MSFHQSIPAPGPESDRKLKFGLFMAGNDGYIPHIDEDRVSNFVDLPNEEFSVPSLTSMAMDRYIRTMEAGERLGFDSLVIMEQRCPSYLNSSMNMASWLLSRTQRIHVGAVGPVMNSYLNPLRLAEEIAMLDMMSGGRFFVGFPLGIGPAYHHMGMNPAEARARMKEGIALIRRAFTEPGPFEHRGEFWHLPIVNLWPRPLRMPDIWMPAAGSAESLEAAAEGGFTYLAVMNPLKTLISNCDRFRQLARDKFGYEPTRDQISCSILVHVAESDEQARKEAEPHLLWFHQNLMRSQMFDFNPPGYTSMDTMKRMMGGGAYRGVPPSQFTFEHMIKEGAALVGSPDTVARGIEEITDRLGAGSVVVLGDCGTMREWMVQKSMTLFAQEVMPRFRPARGRPFWADAPKAGFETLSEAGAMAAKPPRPALANVPGLGTIDVTTSHVDDLRIPVR